MITADASIWIEYFKGMVTPHTEAVDAVLGDSSRQVVLLNLALVVTRL